MTNNNVFENFENKLDLGQTLPTFSLDSFGRPPLHQVLARSDAAQEVEQLMPHFQEIQGEAKKDPFLQDRFKLYMLSEAFLRWAIFFALNSTLLYARK